MCLNGKGLHYFKCAKQNNTANAMNEQGNMNHKKENDNSPKKFKIMGYCDLNNRQFKIAIKKKLN